MAISLLFTAASVSTSGAVAAAPVTRVLSTGTADFNNVQGAAWRRVDFTAARTGAATVSLNWTGTGDLRFNVLSSAGVRLTGNNTTAKPKSVTLNLVAGRAYYVGLWSARGVGTYTLSLTENFPDTDTTPPQPPTGLMTTGHTVSTIALSWTAATDNVGVVGYRVIRNGTQVGTPTATTFNDTGLAAGTSYTYTVRAVDAAGLLSAPSAALIASTLAPPPPDENPPDPPTGLHETGHTSTTVDLSWTAATDDVGVTGYRVFRDGQQVGTPTGTSFHDIGRSPETTYVYSVRAVDAANNVSDPSSDVEVTTSPQPTNRPNIIVINTDDQRSDSIQYLPKIRQWMADGGTTFTRGYVTTPSCCPSRATLMSGRYVHNNGQVQQQILGFDMNLTIQRYLQDSGYLTGMAGKFLHWLPLSQRAPYWDRWTYFKGGYNNVQMNMDGVTRQSSGYSTKIVFDKAVDYIADFEARNDDTPFYLYLTPVAPHSPSTPEPAHATDPVPALQLTPAHDEADRTDKPKWVTNRNNTVASLASTRVAMTRTLFTVDDQVDRLMRELEARGELDNTLVIYTSDNGYMFGEHKLSSKFLPYDPAIKVPFLVRWPGHVAAGVTDDRFVAQVDIAPTVLAAAGVTQNLVTFDGHDVLSSYSRTQVLTEYWNDPNNNPNIPTWAAIRTNEYEYVEYYGLNLTSTTVTYREYYDLVADPYQLQNLLGDASTANDPDVAPLATLLHAARTCVGAACG